MNLIKGHKGFITIPIEERFWKYVYKTDTCWLWTGSYRKKEYPYGIIWDGGKHRSASQVSWELANGTSFPEGMDACHTCDNPSCVRPDHIFPGTAKDNALDALAKGRLKISPRKTHCIHGHAYSDANIYIDKRGKRACKECHRTWTRKWRARAALAGQEWRIR